MYGNTSKIMSRNTEKDNNKLFRVLAIDLEPTPYKSDLWNTVSNTKGVDLSVVYTERRNWAPDGGHNYEELPKKNHRNTVLQGKGIIGKIYSSFVVATEIAKKKFDVTYIAGYTSGPTLIAIFCSILLRRKYAVHTDEFNIGLPAGSCNRLKWVIREILRKMYFATAVAILVCGRRGIETAILAGCSEDKISNFPYVIDVNRLKNDRPKIIPEQCLKDKEEGKVIILFSGRMIPRKGLPTLLSALEVLSEKNNYVLWIEGDGPELEKYEGLVRGSPIGENCRFLGFCQFRLHSWLIRSSDIVVVPSLQDNWGIVVDEGLQLGKVVISSDVTGSGYDRIVNGENGYIFPAGDSEALASKLEVVMMDYDKRLQIGQVASRWHKTITPIDNMESLISM